MGPRGKPWSGPRRPSSIGIQDAPDLLLHNIDLGLVSSARCDSFRARFARTIERPTDANCLAIHQRGTGRIHVPSRPTGRSRHPAGGTAGPRWARNPARRRRCALRTPRLAGWPGFAQLTMCVWAAREVVSRRVDRTHRPPRRSVEQLGQEVRLASIAFIDRSPPSRTSVSPLIQSDSAETRKEIAAATSSGVPSRPSG